MGRSAPVRRAGGGERHDGSQAQARLEGCHAHAVRADTSDEAEELVTGSQPTGALAVIPPWSNLTVLRGHDTARYKERNLVERMCGYPKHCRRVATRDD
ncbi:MAG: hypothetical protein ABI604_13585 [Nitrospirota bacterium]